MKVSAVASVPAAGGGEGRKSFFDTAPLRWLKSHATIIRFYLRIVVFAGLACFNVYSAFTKKDEGIADIPIGSGANAVALLLSIALLLNAGHSTLEEEVVRDDVMQRGKTKGKQKEEKKEGSGTCRSLVVDCDAETVSRAQSSSSAAMVSMPSPHHHQGDERLLTPSNVNGSNAAPVRNLYGADDGVLLSSSSSSSAVVGVTCHSHSSFDAKTREAELEAIARLFPTNHPINTNQNLNIHRSAFHRHFALWLQMLSRAVGGSMMAVALYYQTIVMIENDSFRILSIGETKVICIIFYGFGGMAIFESLQHVATLVAEAEAFLNEKMLVAMGLRRPACMGLYTIALRHQL